MPPASRSSVPALLLLALLTACTGDDGHAPALASATPVGDATCLGCHGEFATYATTAHARTSAPATAAAIDGSFVEGENVLATGNANLRFRMEALPDGGFRQVALSGRAGSERVLTAAKFDVVVGSGRKGQTYLYWDEDRLYQLPISHWTGIGWANSPGYPDGVAVFNRPVAPRCLECHASAAEVVAEPGVDNRYLPGTLVTGISCESCHGPGSLHAAAPGMDGRTRSARIVNPGAIPRERQIDGCALCHGGIGESLRPSFSYRPGEVLAEYLRQPEPPSGARVDVHGNQVAMLARSACFQATAMTCATCHDVHRTQRDPAEFSSSCLSCHTPGEGMAVDHGEAMPGNCVDCHMPNLETSVIVASDAGDVLRPRIRSHWIDVYPEISAELTRMVGGG